MRKILANTTGLTKPRAGNQAHVRIIVSLLLFFVLGMGVGAYWLHRTTSRDAVPVGGLAGGKEMPALSDSTKAVLEHLNSAIKLRFYSLLDPASVPAALTLFAARVDLLLSAYEKEANGKIHVVRHNTPSDSNANAALEDGMRAFNRERGDVCYLGLAVTGNDKKETFPQLSAEWEQALESDLSRAIERVARSEAKQQPTAKAPSGADTTALESVKQAIPNFATLSLEEGTRILREAAIKDFKTAADEMEIKVQEARQRLSAAQNSGSATEQQAAMQQLQQLQAEQAEKLRQIAARSQSQIEALNQLKGAAR